ncbi:MAG: acyl-CoA dehydrogenase family protein [Desulfobacterales bacterium]
MELIIPEQYGGLKDPFSNVVILIEEMGKKSFVSPFFSTVIMCGLILIDSASEAQKNMLLPKIAQGKLIMALAQYEEMADTKRKYQHAG